MASVATLVQPVPNSELFWKIREELKENVNTRDSDVATIKEWLRKQPHLPNDWDSDCIMTFLRGCSFSLEKCKKKLDMYFTMRAACPEFFTNRDMSRPELADLALQAQGPPMPGLTPNGRRITICRGLDKSMRGQQAIDAFKVAMMIGDIRLKEEVVGIAGDIYIFDASIITPVHLGAVSLASIKKFLICVQEAYPVKLKEVHVVNASPIVDAVVNLVKPFLTEKIRNRIFIHTNMNTLYETVPRDLLPTELGGTAGSLIEINKAWVQKLISYKDWFKAQETLVANEALRPGKPTNYDELFGIDGSFRQLSID